MAYLLYKYLRRKFAKHEHSDDSPQAPQSDQQQAHLQTPQTPSSGSVIVNAKPQGRSNRSLIIWRIILLFGLALPVFLETLDYTIVATAQAHIASIFNHLELQSYIGTVYLLTSTVFLPLFASFADIFGRHWTLQLALLLFLVGSAICTGSHNIATLLAGRGISGIGGAGLLAAVRIIMADSASLDDNNWQQSIAFVLYTIGFCMGPFVGGELLNVSFRWVFGINLPVAAAAMAVAFVLLRGKLKNGVTKTQLPSSSPSSGVQQPKESLLDGLLRVDWIGAAFFMAAGILLLLALNWGSSEHWSEAKVIACFVVGGLLAIVYIAWEIILEHKAESVGTQRSKLFPEPMIPVSLFRSLDVCIVQYAIFVSGIIMLVMFYFVAIFSTIVNGFSANKAGAQLIYFAPGMGGGAMIAIFMIKFIRQPKYPAILGGVVSTVALGLISWGTQKNDQGLVNGFMAMSGVGVGLCFGPLSVHARFSQPEELVAVVAALTLFFRSFGGTVGLAQCGAVLSAKVNHYIADAIQSGAISGSDALALASATEGTGFSSLQSIDGLPENVQQIVKDAFRNALRWCFISLIPWSAVSTIGTMFLSHIQDRVHLERGDISTEGKPQDSEGRSHPEEHVQRTVSGEKLSRQQS